MEKLPIEYMMMESTFWLIWMGTRKVLATKYSPFALLLFRCFSNVQAISRLKVPVEGLMFDVQLLFFHNISTKAFSWNWIMTQAFSGCLTICGSQNAFTGDVAWLSEHFRCSIHGLHYHWFCNITNGTCFRIQRKACLHASYILHWWPCPNVKASYGTSNC